MSIDHINRDMRKFKIILIVLFSFICFLALLSLSWAIIFVSYYTAFLILLFFIVFLPSELDSRKYWIIRSSIVAITVILFACTFFIPIKEVNQRIKYLASKPRTTNILSDFTVRDKLGIYGLNIAMGLMGYPIYPEVSKETLLMVLPSPPNGIRSFNSDFALKSVKVRAEIKEFNRKLLSEQPNELIHTKRISWSVSEYKLGKSEARYALALNPSLLTLSAIKDKDIWLIDVSLKVKCYYPQNSSVVLISKPELMIEEGLFWVLQEAGWLFPYTAEWRFTISSDDKRIN